MRRSESSLPASTASHVEAGNGRIPETAIADASGSATRATQRVLAVDGDRPRDAVQIERPLDRCGLDPDPDDGAGERVRDPDGVLRDCDVRHAAGELDRADRRPGAVGDLPERSLRRGRHPGRIGTDRDRTDGGRGHARAGDRPRGAFVEPRHDAVDAQHPDPGRARCDRGGAHGPRAGGDGAGCGVDPHDPEIGRDRPDGALVRRHVVLDEIRERAAAPGEAGLGALGAGRRLEPRDGCRHRPRELRILERPAVGNPDRACVGGDVGGRRAGGERLDDPRRHRQAEDRLGVGVDDPGGSPVHGDRARGPAGRDAPSKGAAPRVERDHCARGLRGSEAGTGLVAVPEQRGGRDGGRECEHEPHGCRAGAAAQRAGGGSGRRLESGVVGEDRLLELLQLRPRLETESIDELAAGVGVHVEGVRLATRSVERGHQLRAKSLAERSGAHQLPQLTDQLAVAAGGEVGVEASLEHLEPRLLQARQLPREEALARQIGERLAAPELEGRPQYAGGLFGAPLLEEPAAFGAELLEPEQVELLRGDREHVSGPSGLEHLMGLEQPPQPRDVLVNRARGVVRPVVAPELLDQPVARDDGPRPEQQQREQAALLDSAEAKPPLAFPHLEGTENAEVEGSRQGPTLPRASGA